MHMHMDMDEMCDRTAVIRVWIRRKKSNDISYGTSHNNYNNNKNFTVESLRMNTHRDVASAFIYAFRPSPTALLFIPRQTQPKDTHTTAL